MIIYFRTRYGAPGVLIYLRCEFTTCTVQYLYCMYMFKKRTGTVAIFQFHAGFFFFSLYRTV